MTAAFEKGDLHVANIWVVSVYLGKGMCFLSVVFEEENHTGCHQSIQDNLGYSNQSNHAITK